MLSEFLIILVPNGLKLLLLLAILVNLLLELVLQLHHLFLKLLDLRLLEVELLTFDNLILIFADIVGLHSRDLLSQFAKLRLGKRHCLSTVPLLLLEFNTLSRLLLLLLLLLTAHHLQSHRLHILHHACCHSLSHVHLLRHWGLS